MIEVDESAAEFRRAHVLASATKVFLAYGFAKATMDDIARAAEMSRPAIYLHFKNKTDIYRSIALDMLTLSAAQAKAESLVAAVACDGLPVGTHELSVRVTAGLAMIRDGDDVQSVLARADAAMYAQRSER